ncbi:hypothetical protein [Flavobacterium branchiophilum]|uniref:Uncharacterized protein n=1 Tax=Flavobacterium branchiophilum TaxID=55197 RepID=A0A2H3KYD4_9FLAO|nr:hypothetical protein [Flavobacterium branchiophilum]PDS24663.1 hypothetical protein B0A77_07290 [Flavobacterium branchiophilum]
MTGVLYAKKLDRNIDDIIREFTLQILKNKQHIAALSEEVKQKEAFLKAIKSKTEVKYSELYLALENDTSQYWKIKEVKLECRNNSFYEIKVFKKYFFSLAQIEIIEKHFMLKFTRTKFDIRITQFY